MEHGGVSRRGFLKGAVLGTAAATGLGRVARADGDGNYPASEKPAPEFDFKKGSGALQADHIVDSACQFCDSLCRLKVHVKDGRVVDVTGEPDDPVHAGGRTATASPSRARAVA